MPALSMASRVHSQPASLNASCELSTSWYLPKCSVAWTLTHWKPYLAPLVQASRKPCSTDGMYSLGMTPPTILSMKYSPLGSGFSPFSSWYVAHSSSWSLFSGSNLTFTTANLPRPPVCLMKRVSMSTGLAMVCR